VTDTVTRFAHRNRAARWPRRGHSSAQARRPAVTCGACTKRSHRHRRAAPSTARLQLDGAGAPQPLRGRSALAAPPSPRNGPDPARAAGASPLRRELSTAHAGESKSAAAAPCPHCAVACHDKPGRRIRLPGRWRQSPAQPPSRCRWRQAQPGRGRAEGEAAALDCRTSRAAELEGGTPP
jgi:hypothetical protein